MLKDFFKWFTDDPIGAMVIICICLMMGSCTVHNVVEEWGGCSSQTQAK